MQRLHTFSEGLQDNIYFVFVTQNTKNMSKNTFLISDESINSYGYIVKTDGIDTTTFERNPIMLYMHERKTVVGRWENIRKDGVKLFADAVFDESTELGRTVKNQVENGFLRSASIGVDIVEEKEINGIKTITKSILFEVSIVDIPANQNALKLYRKGKNQRLALEPLKKVKDLRTSIINLLGLDDDATDESIITEIQHLLNAPDDATIEVEDAIKVGLIDSKERCNYVTMARLNSGLFQRFISSEKEKRRKAVKTAVNEALADRRITYTAHEIYEHIGNKMGIETLSLLFSTMNRTPKLSELLPNGDRSRWTLSDYRKYRPEDLKNNPQLYATLVEAENKKETQGKHTLEYLRKHNPEYLKEHPEEYEKLLANI